MTHKITMEFMRESIDMQIHIAGAARGKMYKKICFNPLTSKYQVMLMNSSTHETKEFEIDSPEEAMKKYNGLNV